MSPIALGAHYMDAQLSKGPRRSVPPVSLLFSQLMVSMTRRTRESVLEKG